VKKLTTIFTIILFLFCLSNCRAKAQAEEEPLFSIVVANQCNEEIYGLRFEYELDGQPMGVGGVRNADNSPIEKGDTLTNDFIPADFSENADLQSFSVQYYVILADEEEIQAGEEITLNPEKGSTYPLVLEGNSTDGFTIKAAS
jgi:hypothetical protein